MVSDPWRVFRRLLVWALLLHAGLSVPLLLPASSVITGLVLAFLAERNRHSRGWDEAITVRQLIGEQNRIQPARSRPARDGYFLGRGGPWTAHHSIDLHQASDAVRGLATAPARRRGAAAVHVPTALLERNILALGAPGSGKSSLLILLAWQAQVRGEMVVVLDPKGSRALRQSLRDGARVAGRPFLALAPASAAESARYDPLRSCRTPGQVADRIAALVAGPPHDPFRAFCHGVIGTLAEAQWVLGERPTLTSLHALLQTSGNALLDPNRVPALGIDPGRAEAARQALSLLASHDRTHFRKMIAGLLPVLQLLTSGPPGALFGGDSGPFPEHRPLLDLQRCRTQGGTVYVGLDVLASPQLGQALACLLLMDLASLATEAWGGIHRQPRVQLMVDEAGELACDPLLQLLGKGREADVHVLIAVQTLADLEWRLGSAAAARVAEGNAGAWFLFRQLDALSRNESEARLGELPLPRHSRSHALARPTGLGGRGGSYTEAHGSTVVSVPRIPAATFGVLRDLECILQLPDGALLHLRLPRPCGP